MCYLVWDESSSFGLDQLPPGTYCTVDCRVVVNDRNRTRARHLG